MQDNETLVHVTSVNSDGTEGRGWSVPVGIWTEIEYAVSFGFRREAYGRPADINSYALNILYHTGKNPRSQYDERIWGYHKVADTEFVYGYLDDREYPNGYAEFKHYQKLRSELMSPADIEAEDIIKHATEQARIIEVMPTDATVFCVAVEGTGRMGDYSYPAEFTRGYFDNLAGARAKARALAKSMKAVVRIYNNPVNIDLGDRGFYNRERMVAEYDGTAAAAVVNDKQAELERLRKVYG